MPYVPPIDRRSLLKSGILDEKRFYQKLSEENNYVEIESVKKFYLGMVRAITKGLNESGVIRLPLLGDFAIVKQADHSGLVGNTRQMLRGKYAVKFYANDSWKRYFNKRSGDTGRIGKLDPREKVLNREL